MIEDDIEDEYFDDPIRLFDSEHDRVFFCPVREEVVIEDSDDVDDAGFKERQTEHDETLYLYKSNSSILPVTFFDIGRNVELLKQCCPLSIKLVDCDKYPWYSEKNKDSTKHNNLNSDINNLQEADCIEILPPDENETYDMILERTTSEDISNINKELKIIRFENENKSMAHKKFGKKMHGEYKRNNFKNNNTDLKRNKEKIGLKVPQSNFMIEAKSDKRKENSLNFDPRNFEETFVDKIDTYARLIDKAYQKLQNLKKSSDIIEHKTYIETNKDSGEHSKKYQNINKSKLHENYETTKLNDIKKNDLNDSIKIKSTNSSKLPKSKSNKNKVTRIFSNSKDDLLISEKSSFKSENLIPDKNKITNVIIEEPKIKRPTLENNNGPRSPLLPCPSNTNKTNNPKNITIVSETPLPPSSQNIKKNNACKNYLFSANRVIPHYHKEFMRTTKTNFNTNLIPSLNRSMPNLFTQQCPSYSNISKERIAHNIYVSKGSPRQSETMAVSSLEATNGSKNNLNSVVNNIPVLLCRKPQHTHSNNVNMPTFPIQRIISSREHFQPNDFIVTPEYPNAMSIHQHIPSLSQNNIYPNHVNYNYYAPAHNLSSRSQSLEIPANVYGLRAPTLYANSQHPLSTLNCLPHHQINNSQIPNTNINYHHYINNYENSVSIENANKHRIINDKYSSLVNRHTVIAALLATDFYANQRTSKKLENDKNNGRKASAYVDKHPYLKQTLEEPPLKINKSDPKIAKTGQRINHNNDGTKIKHHNYINSKSNSINIDDANKSTILPNERNTSNVRKETIIAAMLATDEVNQKAIKKEENTKYKLGREASPRVDKNTHFKESLQQLPLKTSKTDSKNTANKQKIDQNNINTVKPVSKGYSPPILPIPTYQKTFEMLAKIKLYDLEKDRESVLSYQPESNNVSGPSAPPQNLRKRKIGETEKISRRITISEYKKRLSAVESIDLEDYDVNVL